MAPRYRLKSQHYINGLLLEAGTEIGEGTEVPFTAPPSAEMEGVNDEGKKLVAARLKTFMIPVESIPIVEGNK